MFIELTDILRCPADHEEHVLVLLPDGVTDRQVEHGQLGCMECGRVYPIRDGIAEFGTGPAARGTTKLDATAMAAFLGLAGAGGYVALVGEPVASWEPLAELLGAVHIVGVNPPEGTTAGPGLSLVRGGAIPVRSRQLRGVVLGPATAGEAHWVREAERVTLPGLRVVGEGTTPSTPGLEVLAGAEGVWVARRR
jgi:uncharacterized protein YbaR (Trm112 family)